MRQLYFTVTTDLNYDQRMIRICQSLSEAGYTVYLVGRQQHYSLPLNKQPFFQKRLSCFFKKGKLFYAEYNIRLFFFLLFRKMDCICAIDLDTIIPCYLVSRIKNVPRVYDAHELFCEMKEVVTRPGIYKTWKWIEERLVPHFKNGYTVNQPIASEFHRMYGVTYNVIRSITRYEPRAGIIKEKFILYQGAVNEGRSFETLIPAMALVEAPLYICGDGNFMQEAKNICKNYRLEDRIHFKGMVEPELLKDITRRAYIGITLFEKHALSNYYSLANRFFDYIHAGVPQLCVDYPVYRDLNNIYNIAVLTASLEADTIAGHLNRLLKDEDVWATLHNNCNEAAKVLNWQEEEKKLIHFYKNLVG